MVFSIKHIQPEKQNIWTYYCMVKLFFYRIVWSNHTVGDPPSQNAGPPYIAPHDHVLVNGNRLATVHS